MLGSRAVSSLLVHALCLCASVLGASTALAFEPPRVPPAAAVERGNVDIIGRVVALEELERSSHAALGLAKIELIHVFYGLEMTEGQRVAIQHHHFLETDAPALPLELRLGETLLFVLSSPRPRDHSDQLRFDSTWKSGIDLAYRVQNGSRASFQESESLRMKPVWGGPWYGVTFSELVRAAEVRAAALRSPATAD